MANWGVSKASCWWKDLCGIREGVGEIEGRWFENGLDVGWE